MGEGDIVKHRMGYHVTLVLVYRQVLEKSNSACPTYSQNCFWRILFLSMVNEADLWNTFRSLFNQMLSHERKLLVWEDI